MMKFIKFIPGKSRDNEGSNVIKVGKKFMIKFPSKFISKNELTGSNYVSMYYNRESEVIGFMFYNLHVTESYKLSKNKSIGAKSFFQFFDIKSVVKAYDYKVVHEGEDKYFTFKI